MNDTSTTNAKTLLCLTALCLPRTEWAARYLRALGNALAVPSHSIDGAVTLTHSASEESSMLYRAETMAIPLRSTLQGRIDAITGFVTIFLLTLRGNEFAAMIQNNKKRDSVQKQKAEMYQVLRFDARTSVVLRRLALLLRIKLSTVAALEELALRKLQQETALLQQQNNSNKKNRRQSSLLRSAKIGAAAVAAGGLLFVTGGLAAPALAAGLSGLGLAGAASLTTATLTATLLGTAGAGLTAYKVSRRTQGLSLLEFHSVNTEKPDTETLKGMTVYICISGHLRQEGPSADSKVAAMTSPDFYSPWGARPPHLSAGQILDRFYAAVAPDKRGIAPALLRHYRGRERELFRRLRDVYLVHPLDETRGRPTTFLTGMRVATCQQLLDNGMVRVRKLMEVAAETPDKKSASNAKLSEALTEMAIAALVDTDRPWDSAVEEPPEMHAVNVVVSEEDAKRALEEIEKKMNATSLDDAMISSSASVDSQEADKLQAEIELLAMEDTVASGKLGFDHVSKTLLRASPATTRQETVYWWRESIANYGDQYTVVWDPDNLLEIGNSVQNLIREGVDKGIKKALQYTALSTILSAVAMPLAIVSLISGLDEAWTITGAAANEAGLLLADALLSDAHGNRPVVLIGYSMGGRVVASCLNELAMIANGKSDGHKSYKQVTSYADDDYPFLAQSIENDDTISKEERQRRLRAATVVRDAVIIGAPVDSAAHKWALRRSIVLGRLINVFSPSDWVLAMIYRYKRWSVIPLAGLREVQLPEGRVGVVENFDVSDIVDSHGDYPAKMMDILQRIGVGDVDCELHHSRYFPLEQKLAS